VVRWYSWLGYLPTLVLKRAIPFASESSLPAADRTRHASSDEVMIGTVTDARIAIIATATMTSMSVKALRAVNLLILFILIETTQSDFSIV
jgi:hypothetical protein